MLPSLPGLPQSSQESPPCMFVELTWWLIGAAQSPEPRTIRSTPPEVRWNLQALSASASTLCSGLSSLARAPTWQTVTWPAPIYPSIAPGSVMAPALSARCELIAPPWAPPPRLWAYASGCFCLSSVASFDPDHPPKTSSLAPWEG